jgi:drug/metabolite transporter (DMT)-like permease
MRHTPQAGGERAARLGGIGLFCISMMCFTALDTLAKFASHSVPVIEIVWVRFLGQTVFVVIALRPWRSLEPFRMHSPVAQIVRAVALFGSTLFNFLALRTLQMDQTATIGFSSAFVVAGLAGPVLGEWIGWRRWLAIFAGFVGVVLVISPGTANFDPALLLSVASTLSYSAYNLMTRKQTETETATSLLLYSGLVPSLFLAPVALPVAVWPPTVLIGAAIVGTAIFGAIGHGVIIQAYRRAPASLLAPFAYTQIIWMPAAGYLAFGDVPGGHTLIGAAIIVASGLYILYRERVHGDR